MTKRWTAAAMLAVAMSAALAVGEAAAQEGVTVKGHWVVDIFNADGSRAARHEFDNALTANGRTALAVLLSRRGEIRSWAIGTNSLCGTGGGSPCYLMQPAAPASLNGWTAASQNLAVTMNSGGSLGTVSLAGSATVTGTGSISTFTTYMAVCGDPSQVPGLTDCAAPSQVYLDFSQRGQSISIQAGQVLQITVTFSFV
jgi:hypothetical protein